MSDLRLWPRPAHRESAIPANPEGAVLLRSFGEPLRETLRIPCYEGLHCVRLTYSGFVRQIRGVFRVAMPLSQKPGGKLPFTPTGSRYRYSTSTPLGSFLEQLESGAGQAESVTVRVSA